MPASKKGTGFINLQQYLDLNKSGAQMMGDAVSGMVNSANRSASGSINDAETAVRDKASAAVRNGGEYAGPNSFSDAANMGELTSKVAEAQKLGAAAQTQAGRAQLLVDKFGPNTWGGSALDSALAGAGGGAQGIADAGGGTARLGEFLAGKQAATNAYIDQSRATSAKNAQAALQASHTTPMGYRPPKPPLGPTKSGRKNDDLDMYGRR